MELSNSNIKKILIFPYIRKLFLYFEKQYPQKNFLYFIKRKLFYISGNGNPEKISYILGNGAFLCFRKRKP